MVNKEQNKIAIFDLDGSLVETDAANNAAYRVALAGGGVQLHGMYGRITASAIREAGVCRARIDEIIKAKIEAYCHELWRTRLGAAADALKCVLVDRSAFDKIVLLTDSNERRAMETLKYWQMDRCFDEIVCNAGRGDKYANYFKDFDTDPAASVVWENEDGKVQSAIAAGVKAENARKVG